MRFFVTLLFLFSSLSLLADAGNGYRFYLELVSKDSDTITGYFYHYSYDEYDKYNHYDENFKSFIKKDSINLYSFILTIPIGNETIDFTNQDYKKKVFINDFNLIRVRNYLSIQPVHNLKELTQPEFDLIKLHQVTFDKIYNDKVAENCFYVLLTWENNFDLSKHSKEINEKLILFGQDVINNQNWFYDYLNLKKAELLDEKILIINYCYPL